MISELVDPEKERPDMGRNDDRGAIPTAKEQNDETVNV
jgi:hypothetical protein